MFNHPPKNCGIYRLGVCAIYSNAHSCVYPGYIKSTGEKVVLKFIPIFPDTIKYVDNECDIQSTLHHPFIMSTQNSDFTYRNNSYRILQMPAAECSLAHVHEYVHNIRTIYKIMYQAVLAISYLHDLRILHGDIKPENFVLMNKSEENIEIRVIDFGHSTRFKLEDMDKCTTDIASGTTTFNPPELLIKSTHSFPADIWSLGATFYYLITGESVINFNHTEIMYRESRNIYLRYIEKFGPQFPPEGKKLLDQMLKFDPKERPTAEQCVQSQFFAEFLDSEWVESQHLLVRQMIEENKVPATNTYDSSSFY